MTTLKFADTHNMVAFLSKPTESDGFEQIVDFLNAHPIRYALTINPTIYISCIEQFWSTAMVKTINGEAQLHALVDGKKIIITESSVRRDLQLADEEGVDCLPNSTIFEQLTLMGPKTTAWNEFSSTMASAIICLATNQKFNFSKFIFDSMIRNLDNLSGKFLMYPRVGKGSAILTDPHHTPTFIQPSTQPQKTQQPRKPKRKDTQVPRPSDPIENVADKVVHKELGDSLVRAATIASSLEAEVESSTNEESLGEDASKQRRIDAIDADEEITLVSVQNIDEEIFDVNVLDGEEVFVTEQEVASNKENDEVNVVEEVVEVINTANVLLMLLKLVLLLGKSTPTISSQQSHDKGKGILIEPVKKKDQILLDEETALNLQAKFDEEERLAREKAEKEKEVNIALIETRDYIQAKINVDHQLAERMQAQEQEEDNRVGGRQKKRAGIELVQEITKKQKVEDDKETTKLKQRMEIIPDEEEVAIDAIPLASRSPSIIGWKIHKEGRKSYYQIIRADRKSQMYMIFSHMLKSFDKEDLEDLYKLVKAKYESTRTWTNLDLILWGDLKTMFEPHVEDKVWKNQQDYKVLNWKLYDSFGVHSLRM
ncbi:hypothetical protein Tco_0494318 [Tanacetum coccineum]